MDSFEHKSVSVNVKPLSELCKLAILGNVRSSGQGVNDGLLKLSSTQVCKAGASFSETLEGLDLSELGRCWELERSETHVQVADVQGRLSQAYTFWKDTLHAPELVLDWIQTGYK